MNQRIKKAVSHIETHLDSKQDIKSLAHISGYSHYHFCRVFKLQLGESVMAYITRLRIEAASLKVGYENKGMFDIALDSGFETPTGFTKAFKKHFNMTPTAYKKLSREIIMKYQDIKIQPPEIVTRPEIFVVYQRELGDYFVSAEIAWDKLTKSLDKLEGRYKDTPLDENIVLDEKKAELLGICYDDPEVTDQEKIRYEACLAWSEQEIEFLKAEGFDTKKMAKGRYAKVLHKGSYESSNDSWYGLYGWVENKGYELRDEPSFEKYLNTPDEVKEPELLTEIYVPIN